MLFGRNDAKAETPVLWPPHAKSWFIWKDPDAGKDRGPEEKRMTEDEMAGWHHRLDARESEWTPGVGDGQGGLACCDSWGCKETDTTERMNWTELNVDLKDTQCESCELNFIWGKNEDCSQETAPQLHRGGVRVGEKVSIYVILVKRGYMESSTYFSRKFLLVSWSFC